MTISAALFMLTAWSAITLLTGWCLDRVLRDRRRSDDCGGKNR